MGAPNLCHVEVLFTKNCHVAVLFAFCHIIGGIGIGIDIGINIVVVVVVVILIIVILSFQPELRKEE